VQTNIKIPLWFIVGIILTSLVALAINIPSIQFDPFYLWIRLGVPALLLVGFSGSLYGLKVARIVGWIGILVFVRCGVQLVLPGEGFISGGPDGPPLSQPHLASTQDILVRLAIVVSMVVGLVWAFWVAGTSNSGQFRGHNTN
jgi:hypothetical protein